MSIVLSLTGKLNTTERLSRTEARDWLAGAAIWFEGVGDAVLDAHVVRDAEEKPVLLIVFHPASPTVEVRLGSSGKLRVDCGHLAHRPRLSHLPLRRVPPVGKRV